MGQLNTRLVIAIMGVFSALMLVGGLWIDTKVIQALRTYERHHVEQLATVLLGSLQGQKLYGGGVHSRAWINAMHDTPDVIDVEIIRHNKKEAFTDLTTIDSVNAYLGEKRFKRDAVLPHEKSSHVDQKLLSQALNGQLSMSWQNPGELTLLAPIATQDGCKSCHGYNQHSVLGVLKLTLSTKTVDADIMTMRSSLWTIPMALIIALGSIMWWSLRLSVLMPIKKLHAAIVLVSQGDRNTRLDSGWLKEFDAVAAAFNHMQIQLQNNEVRIQSVMDNVLDVIVTVDEKGTIESINKAACNVFGYHPNELQNCDFITLIPETHHNQFQEKFTHLIETGTPQSLGITCEMVGSHKDGSTFTMDLAVSEMWQQGTRYFIGIIRDITERKCQMAAIEYQALHDTLTGLPNRALLADRLEHAILETAREMTPLGLIIMDLDHFKEINDTLGHHCGDAVLQEVAQRVKGVLRKSDTVARLGGDEYSVVLPGAGGMDATDIAEKILHTLGQPFELDGQSYHVGGSLGIALLPEHGTDLETLMKHADVAMYAAKRGKTGFAIYDPSKDFNNLQHLTLMNDLRSAISQNQLLLHYQPKVHMQTGQIKSVEALVRWQHPQYGLMYPDEFIPMAEQSGMIKPLILWVMKKSLAQYDEWQKMGMDIAVAVNLSARNLQDKGFPEEMGRLLQAYHHTQLSHLRLEITETAIMNDPTRATEVLKILGAMGVGLSIDDFGTSYSSLIDLKQLPVVELKIDKSFVIKMSHDEDSAMIVRSTIDLAHNLKMQVVAEGIEDHQTYEMLAKLGCDEGQGYFICRPIPPDKLQRWLQLNSMEFQV